MPPLLPTNPLVLKVIKVMSCLLIAGALGLVVSKASGMMIENALMERLFWIGSIALLFHVLEAMVAVILAHRLNENPAKAAAYTFWTGVAGISEMLQKLEASNQTVTDK